MPQASPRTVPVRTTDAEAEAFLAQDLSSLDFTQFKPMRFEILPKSARLAMRLPEPLIAALKSRAKPRAKARAKARGIPCQRLIREVLGRGVAGGASTP